MEKMQNAMMKRYKMFAWLGLVIVLIAVLLAIPAANANATKYFISHLFCFSTWRFSGPLRAPWWCYRPIDATP